MRLIGGKYRGRRLVAPAGRGTRPTTDRLRESVFNIISHQVDLSACRVLDVFAGTGALGLEALSRGAQHSTFIENERQALQAIKDNVATVGAGDQVTVLRLDAVRLPLNPGAPYDLVLLDPPYNLKAWPGVLETLAAQNWLAPGARLVCEQAAAAPSLDALPTYDLDFDRHYGTTRFTFLTYQGTSAEETGEEPAEDGDD